MNRVLAVVDLGRMGYEDALVLQRAAAHARISGALADDTLLFVEHPPVVTLGRSTDRAHLLLDQDALSARGVEMFEVERGGDITFHGPGQVVGYPIMDLRTHRQDLHWYLRQLEEALIRALGTFGIPAERREKLTGVWTNGRKIASIGVHARNWVTWHGFALNVTTDLSYFGMMVPCGIDDVEMTSVARELSAHRVGERAAVSEELAPRVRSVVSDELANLFGLDVRPMAPAALHSLLPHTVTDR